MSITDGVSDLGFHDNGFFDNQIRDEFAHEPPTIVNGKRLLLTEVESLLGEFEAKGVFVNLFVQAGAEFAMHSHGRTNDFLGEIAMGILCRIEVHG